MKTSKKIIILGALALFPLATRVSADCIRSCEANLYVRLTYQPEGQPNTERKTGARKTLKRASADGREPGACVPSNLIQAKRQACTSAVTDLQRRYLAGNRQKDAVCEAVEYSKERGDGIYPVADWYRIDQMYAYGKRDAAKAFGKVEPIDRSLFRCEGGRAVAVGAAPPPMGQSGEEAAPPPPPTLRGGSEPAPPPTEAREEAAPPPPPTLVDRAKQACEQWCDNNERCVECVTGACPGETRRVMRWRGPTGFWNACVEMPEDDSGGAGAGSEATALPDLYISEFQLNPAELIQGRPVQVRVGVYNLGNAPAGAFTVQWWPGENYRAPACTWRIDRMAARGGRILNCNYDGYPSWYARIRTKASADTANEVRESDESNNSLVTSVTVGRP